MEVSVGSPDYCLKVSFMLKSLSLIFDLSLLKEHYFFGAINLSFLCVEVMLSKADPGCDFSEDL